MEARLQDGVSQGAAGKDGLGNPTEDSLEEGNGGRAWGGGELGGRGGQSRGKGQLVNPVGTAWTATGGQGPKKGGLEVRTGRNQPDFRTLLTLASALLWMRKLRQWVGEVPLLNGIAPCTPLSSGLCNPLRAGCLRGTVLGAPVLLRLSLS